jgi:hypothetical protein
MAIHRHRLAWGLALTLICAGAKAQTSDSAVARAHLQQGYTLKQQGKCDAAIPHFEESSRLDRQPKALLNLADCEEKLGRLASALSHSVEARDLAQAQRLVPLQKLAEQRRQALEKRVPRLVVRLGKDAPEGTTILRDGLELGAVSLNTPLPADPGKHVVVARSSTVERTFEVMLVESETKEIEVTPVGGRQLRASSLSPAHTPKHSTPAEAPSSRSAAAANSLRTEAPAPAPIHSGLGGQRIAALLTGGAALAAFTVGGYFGARALSTYKAADCDASNVCSDQGLADQNRALGQARNATIATVGGLVALTAGVVLWFTAPTSPSTDSAAPRRHRLWFSADPLGENGARSMTVVGTF